MEDDLLIEEFLLDDHPDQEFTTILNDQRCTLRFRYNPTLDRWSFDLRIGDTDVLFGRRIVPGIDLIGAFNFGLGSIVAIQFEEVPANKEAIANRRVRVYHVLEVEDDDALAA